MAQSEQGSPSFVGRSLSVHLSEPRPPGETSDPERAGAPPSVGEPHGGPHGAAKPPTVRYLGFRTTAEGREYSLRATDELRARMFVMLIPHRDFASREARFQDGPDLCFAKLQRDLAAEPDLLPGPLLVVTARELVAYREAREKSPSVRRRRTSTG